MRLNIIKQRRLWWGISLGAIVLSLIAMAISFQQFGSPIRPGLDFVGGTRLQLTLACADAETCAEAIDVSTVRDAIAPLGLENSAIQVVEDYTLSLRSNTLDVKERTTLIDTLSETIGAFDIDTIQVDTVGPTVGAELLTAGVRALLAAFFGIVVYLSFRFRFDYAVFAIVALFHDVLLTTGVFALLGFTAGNEIDSLFLVALLTIIGFSVNDTVVIYDRIREINDASEPGTSIDVIVDEAVNQTLTRSINTSLTTILPLVAIFLFGGQTLQYFAFALIIGFLAGAYSSIFIASTLLSWWRERQEVSEDYEPAPAPLSDEV